MRVEAVRQEPGDFDPRDSLYPQDGCFSVFIAGICVMLILIAIVLWMIFA